MQRFNFEVRLKQDSDEKSILSSSSRPVAVAVPDERGPYVLWEAAVRNAERAYAQGVKDGRRAEKLDAASVKL